MDIFLSKFIKNISQEKTRKITETVIGLKFEDICRSRANEGENLYVRTQAIIRQAFSALASSVNVDSDVSSLLASSTSLSTNLTVLLVLWQKRLGFCL